MLNTIVSLRACKGAWNICILIPKGKYDLSSDQMTMTWWMAQVGQAAYQPLCHDKTSTITRHVNSVHRMMIWFDCCATHGLRVIVDVEFYVDTHFQIWPKESSISGQIFTFGFFVQNTCLVSNFVSRIPKKVIHFDVRQWEVQKYASNKWGHQL